MKLAQSPSSSTNADSFIDTQTAIIRPREEEEEGGKRGEKRKERGFSLHGLYIYIYIHETFSCSREADTGREGIKQTGRQDADGGGREEGARVGLNACGCLNRTQPRCSAISRVPVAPEMLPNSLHLRPALYSPGNALSPFLKVQEAARTAFPSLSLQPSLFSLSLSFSSFPSLFSFSTSIPCNFPRRAGKGRERGPSDMASESWRECAPMTMMVETWRNGTRTRRTFTLLPSFASTPIALHLHLEEAEVTRKLRAVTKKYSFRFFFSFFWYFK